MIYFDFMNPYIIHVIYNLLTIGTIAFIFSKKKLLIKHKKHILIVVTIILLYTQTIRYVYPLLTGRFTLTESLPFFICRISVLALTIYMFFPIKALQPLLYFWGATGLFAVFIPNGNIENIRILNETFFIDHYLLAVTPFYLLKVDAYKPTYQHVLITTFAFGLLLIGFIPINNYLEADYFYLRNQAVLQVLLPGLTSLQFAIIHTIAVFLLFNIYYGISLKTIPKEVNVEIIG